jgi:hypothetical protein
VTAQRLHRAVLSGLISLSVALLDRRLRKALANRV